MLAQLKDLSELDDKLSRENGHALIADSSATNTVNFSSACTMKRLVVAVCICYKDFCPLELIVETQPQLQPALLRLSAMISQYFTRPLFAFMMQRAR
jgi:hypothetical protein